MYSKQTRATRIADTLYFKHKYLTSPAVTPEDAVVAAAQQLTNALKGNSISDSEHFKNLKIVAKVFEDIANEKAAEANENEITNNGIRPHPQETIPLAEAPTTLPAEPPPRVPTPTPRVNAPSPRMEIEPQLLSRVQRMQIL